jgi:hypothetical protein
MNSIPSPFFTNSKFNHLRIGFGHFWPELIKVISPLIFKLFLVFGKPSQPSLRFAGKARDDLGPML